jgi:hypothetical protein
MIQTLSPAQANSIISTAFGCRTLVVFQGCGFSAPHHDRSVSHQTNPDVILSEAKDLSRRPFANRSIATIAYGRSTAAPQARKITAATPRRAFFFPFNFQLSTVNFFPGELPK